MIKLVDIIIEGRYNSEVLRLSRYAMQMFKAEMGQDFVAEDIVMLRSKYIYDPSQDIIVYNDDDYIETKLVITFEATDAFELGGMPFVIEGDAGYDDIKIEVQYDPTQFPQEYNQFIAEMKDTLRHEMEHIAQANLFGKETIESYPDNYPFYKYLQLNHEVPAFVRGLYARAKTKRMPLADAFEEFFDQYIDRFKSQMEIDQVRNTWTKWTLINLPKVRI